MDSSDNEQMDEWVESYDEYDTDEEFESIQSIHNKSNNLYFEHNDKMEDRSEMMTSEDEDDDEAADDEDEESDEENENEEDNGNEGDKLKNNPAWADAISKILRMNKPKNKKIMVLSKAKKISDFKKKELLETEGGNEDFEIVSREGKEDEMDEKPDIIKEERKAAIKKRILMKEMFEKGRVKPSILEKDRERTLAKIATRGVVQLFNAVRQQQNLVDKKLKKAGKSHNKQEKILKTINKKDFLNVLSGVSKSVPLDEYLDTKEEVKEEDSTSWDVLREDFMMGARLKDWDKKENLMQVESLD